VKRQLSVVIAHTDIVEVCCGVKRLLAVVTVDSDIVEVLLTIPHIFANVEYADTLYVYGFCDGSTTAAVEEYRRRFHMRGISDRRMFSKVFNTFREFGPPLFCCTR
jgi:ABC-type Na+ transport system ATPase subunit NatA